MEAEEELAEIHEACREIAEQIIEAGFKDVERIKLKVSKKYGLRKVPSNVEILQNIPAELREKVKRVLSKKPVKTISGVSVITVVSPIRSCPHGACIYCPGGDLNSPRSYTGEEESVRMASLVDYDPYLQVQGQVGKLERMGHDVDKVELIFIAGTFNAMPYGFQRWFLKRCLDMLNGVDSSSLEEALRIAEERPKHRVSGITVETRPDWVKRPRQAERLLEMGVTRVEIGVQILDDEVYRLVRRGHTVEDVAEATRTLKDLAFKVGYHLMPNLPGSSLEKDLECYRRIWVDERFRPDMIKIYPTLVLPGTILHEWWKSGRYRPYRDEDLVKLLADWLLLTPPYVRIQRIQREIPLDITSAGNRVPNLREVVENYLKMRGLRCRCIRCREVGHRLLKDGVKVDPDSIKLVVRRYKASGGLEYFISYEDISNDILVGFLRLRSPSQVLRKELENAALVRELHVYGRMIPVGAKDLSDWTMQHRSYGSRLLAEAERIAVEELDARKIVVISGVGVRKYYYRHGYRRDGPYVSKRLS